MTKEIILKMLQIKNKIRIYYEKNPLSKFENLDEIGNFVDKLN